MTKNSLKEKINYKFLAVLVMSSVLSISLSFFRMYKTDTIIYGFLVWNLFLAWIPFVVSSILVKLEDKFNSKVFNFSMFFIWLLFFPNSPYILTDIIHLVDIRDHVPIWYDLMLILSFAWSGLLVGLVSLSQIHKILNKKMKSFNSWLIIFLSIFLCSFGVYLGRYQRWNSWDLFTQPLTLVKGMILNMFEPAAGMTSVGVTGLFTIFITISYLTFYSLNNHNQNQNY